MRKYLLISALFFTFSSVSAQITVTDFLPQNYVTDGSVNYSKEIQQAMDKAGELKSTVVFPAMLYLVNEIGLTLRSGITLSMYGATFIIDKNSATDGQVFQGTDISDLNMFGGEIAGGKSKWPDGVNIRGVYLKGNSQNIRIRDMFIHDISSNGIGIFGEDNLPAQNVWVQDIVIDKGCNFYGDYMSERPGTEAGSVREDQGLIALYFVNNFVVRGAVLKILVPMEPIFTGANRDRLSVIKFTTHKWADFFSKPVRMFSVQKIS